MVTRYKARGMPTHSIAAAVAWKNANVRLRAGTAWVPEERVYAISAGVDADAELAHGVKDGPRVRALRTALRAMEYDEELELSRQVWLALVGYYMHPEVQIPTGRPSERMTIKGLAALITPSNPLPELWWYAACDANDVTIHGWQEERPGGST